jgi:hypothetical protein
MPNKCCVPECHSNYDSTKSNHVTVYKIESECKGDDSKLKKWLTKMPRVDLTVTKHTGVCIKHFVPLFIITHDSSTRSDGSILAIARRVPKLSKDTYPSVFENCPQYLTSEPPAKRRHPDERRSDLEQHDNAILTDWF